MPRARKSTFRPRENRHQTRADTQNVKGARATATEEEAFPSSSPSGRSRHSSPTARVSQDPPTAPPVTAVTAGARSLRATRRAQGQGEGGPSSSGASAPAARSGEDPLNQKKVMLLRLLLKKYSMNQPIKKAEMMKIVTRKYKEHFPELLRRVAQHMVLVYGLELQEADSKGENYILVDKVETTEEEVMGGSRVFPKEGILLPLLGMMYINGERATEEEVWGYLRKLGVFRGEQHDIYGELRMLITNDLVEEKYLEYRQVPNSDPPRYEFLWGPRAHGEATKIAVLEYVAECIDTDPSVLEVQGEEASESEEWGATGPELAAAGPSASASASATYCLRAKPRRCSHSS